VNAQKYKKNGNTVLTRPFIDIEAQKVYNFETGFLL